MRVRLAWFCGCSGNSDAADVLDPVLVSGAIVGSKEGVNLITGSATYLDIDDLRVHSISDINSALRRVPGVTFAPRMVTAIFRTSVCAESTWAAAPRLPSWRTASSRPRPVLCAVGLLQPNPRADERLGGYQGFQPSEVRAAHHGRRDQYLSTAIPEELTTYSKVYYGSFDEMVAHIYHGGKQDTDIGRIGYLVEGYYRTTDGFKELQGAAGETGFTRSEPMLKLSWEPNTANYQSIELKLSSTDFDANETYLGITDEDFGANPYTRYAATRNDRINTYASRGYLRHFAELSGNASLKTTAYFNNFHRNWFKLDKVNGKSAYKEWDDPSYLAVVKGEAAGELRNKANNRDYSSKGIESVLTYDLALGSLDNQVKLGVRYHKDKVNRLQWYQHYTQDSSGNLATTGPNAPSGKAGDRRQNTEAWSVYLEDRIAINDKLIVAPASATSLWTIPTIKTPARLTSLLRRARAISTS